MTSRKRCKCASLPEVIEGTSSKGPSRHLLELDKKSPPPALRALGIKEVGVELPSKYPVYLMQCQVCNQLWQCDAPTGIRAYCVPQNWTARCIKLETAENWQNFDCTPIRVHQLVIRQGGHSDRQCRNRKKSFFGFRAKCKNKALSNKEFCEHCLYHTMKDM